MNLGCRPLKPDEVPRLLEYLHTQRDRTLFLLCLYTGFRITEALSLRVRDVYKGGQVMDHVTVSKRSMKGKRRSRAMALHENVASALQVLLASGEWSPDTYLFKSQRGENAPIGRVQAYAIISSAARRAGLTGKIGTHTARKTFAELIYAAYAGDLLKTSRALGHASPVATASYLASMQTEIDSAVLGLKVGE